MHELSVHRATDHAADSLPQVPLDAVDRPVTSVVVPQERRAVPLSPYPIQVAVSRSVLERWCSDEYASWEDHGCSESGHHVYCSLRRGKTFVRADSAEEALLLIDSGTYHGDAGGWDDALAYRGAVARVTKELKALMTSHLDSSGFRL